MSFGRHSSLQYQLHSLPLRLAIFPNISLRLTVWELEDQVVIVFRKRYAGAGQ
jgi:hypothetical protein